jgi:hypothetical protein
MSHKKCPYVVTRMAGTTFVCKKIGKETQDLSCYIEISIPEEVLFRYLMVRSEMESHPCHLISFVT